MNHKTITTIAFALMCIAQLYIPAKMIIGQEDILKTGTAFKFRTAPVDPNDPFRGKYITLSYQDTEFPAPDENIFKDYPALYVELETGNEGFAQIKNISDVRPSHSDYVICENYYQNWRDDKSYVNIQFPFDRYYMEEFKAPVAEDAYQEFNRDTSLVTYALVHVKDGDAVVEDVVMDDISIKERVKMQMDNK